MRHRVRRAFLALTGAAAAVALSGCIGGTPDPAAVELTPAAARAAAAAPEAAPTGVALAPQTAPSGFGATASRPPTESRSATATRTTPPTASPSPTHTATATPTRTPTATPTPAPRLVQLTDGGCCTQPFWAPDSRAVRFIDKPAGGVTGIYEVALEAGTEPRLVSERIEESAASGPYLVLRDAGATTIERLADGVRWGVPARGRNVIISPDEKRIAWSITDDDLPPDRQVTAVWVADLDGKNARQIATLRRGGIGGWIDGATLLVSGREGDNTSDQVLWRMNVADAARQELARAERLRSPTLSPSGHWVAYYSTFERDATRNGLWIVATDGRGPARQAERALFGAYQWRACGEGCADAGDPRGSDRLVIVPFSANAQWHEFWELDPATLAARRLTDPGLTPVKIANGDWRVSPDGAWVAFVSALDRNTWALALPQ